MRNLRMMEVTDWRISVLSGDEASQMYQIVQAKRGCSIRLLAQSGKEDSVRGLFIFMQIFLHSLRCESALN